MKKDFSVLHINGLRLLSDINELGKIGITENGGITRTAFSQEDIQARNWFKDRIKIAGLIFSEDSLGNISGILPCNDRGAKTILFGSHLDTVPNGGRFDGSLGVIAGLEVLRTIKDNNIHLPYNLEVIDFSDEEGTWYGSLGSSGVVGALSPNDYKYLRKDKKKFTQSILFAGISPQDAPYAKRDPQSLKAWIEVHIEQGSRLEESGIQIGVVTSIVGIANFKITFIGMADHAGTTMLDKRRNALLGLANFVIDSQKVIHNDFPDGVINCGVVTIKPNVVNIVPGVASVIMEIRHNQEMHLTAMKKVVLELASTIAKNENLNLEVETLDYHPPAIMDEFVLLAIEQACDNLKLSHNRLKSYAGHDTQVMSRITPSGMFFVPSIGGASHCPREFTTDDDCIRAGEVLLRTIIELANK